MAIPWDSIRSLAIFFGPVLLPKAISYYRSIRSASSRRGNLAIQPAPLNLRIVIFLLCLLAFSLVLAALPFFSPENIFLKTQSRLQIPVDVLFTRLAALRASSSSSSSFSPDPRDALLRSKFVNLENRLLYLQFGPAVLADCPFCGPDDPRTYFYYAIPALLWPHVANLAVLAASTSPSLTGRHGSQWRAPAVIAAALLAAADIYLVSAYKHQLNARALRLADIDPFFWDMRRYRLLATAALHAVLAALLWLSSTNRAFTQPLSTAERVELVNRAMLVSRSKLNALGIVKNTVARDEALRSRTQAYWQHEVRLMGEVMEDKDVIDGVNDALSNRIDIDTVTRDAEQYADNVMKPF